MIVVVVVCLLVIVGLAVQLQRLQTRIAERDATIDGLRSELAAADNEVTEALTATARAERARDDALERVQRAKRDASEVAGRLSAETDRAQQLDAEIEGLRAELAAAQAADDDERIAALWALTLAGTERAWRTSVALAPDEDSPLAGIDRPLREAIEIEIDAAREEAGADIELHWEVDEAVELADAVQVLVTARELIATVAKTAAHTELTVRSSGDGLELVIDARDDASSPLDVAIPGLDAAAPGRYRVAG